jgi:hypothetical protein
MKLRLNTFEDKLRRKTRRIVLMQGAYGFLMAALSVGLLFYAFFILAYFAPQILPFSIPSKLLISLLVLVPVTAGIIAAYCERRDTIKMTLKLEKQYPHLQDRLLTLVELSQNKQKVEQNAFSRVLAKSLEADMMDLMDRFNFNGAAHIKKLAVPVFILIFFLTAGTVHALVQNDFFVTGFKRLTEPLDRSRKSFSFFKHQEFEIKVMPGDVEIARGSNLMIQALTPGHASKQAVLRLKKTNESAWEELPMETGFSGQFQIQLNQILSAAVYTVRVDGHESATFQIKIFESLRLEKVMWTLTYPEYTRIKEQNRQGWGGKITVPRGTKLHLDLTLNQPVAEGSIEDQEGKSITLKKTAERELTAEIEASKDFLLKLSVKAEKGDMVLEAPPLWIQVLPDLAPYLEILEPQQQNYVFPTQEVPFHISANDDYGLKAVDLVIRYQGKEERIHWLPEGKPVDTIVLEPILKLEKFDLHSRDLVYAYIEVRDTFPGEDPAHIVKSELFVFLIRDFVEQYKINLPKSSTPSVRQYFEDIMAEQEKIMTDTWDYISQPPREGPTGWENSQKENGND